MRRWSSSLLSNSRFRFRCYSTQRTPDRINYNPDASFSDVPDPKILTLPRVTSNDLASQPERPRNVLMLTRDYIENALYNPHYGYFSKQASIISSSENERGLDFSKVRDSREFQGTVAQRYSSLENEKKPMGPGSQIWHTPTELFKPWYGEAIARCLVSEYLLKYFPYEDFIIYEMGAGNGTLARNILDFLAEEHPEVYERTQYHIVEISETLANVQRQRLQKHHSCVSVTRRSIFDWSKPEYAPCFVLALEVVDNFAHDAIRYELESGNPYQTLVVVDDNGEFSTVYEPVKDPLIASFLASRRLVQHDPPIPAYIRSPTLRALYRAIPFSSNLSLPEYIPTRLLSLLQVLRKQFPRHKLLLSDFCSLPDTIKGYNAPVVQTRIHGQMVPCSTLLVQPGYFDIFFPTDFELLRDLYESVIWTSNPSEGATSDGGVPPPTRASPLTSSVSSAELGAKFFFSKSRRMPMDGVYSGSGLPVGPRKSSVFTHREFLETYAQLEKTQLRSGENPMLDYYKNVKFLF